VVCVVSNTGGASPRRFSTRKTQQPALLLFICLCLASVAFFAWELNKSDLFAGNAFAKVGTKHRLFRVKMEMHKAM